jgi:hypothetical protein
MAPCPSCELGRQIEFPRRERSPWGRLGYWCGRPWDWLKRDRSHQVTDRLPVSEVMEMLVSLGWLVDRRNGTTSPPEAIEVPIAVRK